MNKVSLPQKPPNPHRVALNICGASNPAKPRQTFTLQTSENDKEMLLLK
jgi:hypothetical protein